MSDLKAYLRKRQRIVDTALRRFLPKPSVRPATVHRAMRHPVFAGGKRLRPVLCLAAAEACGGASEEALAPACAVELIHTYSLVHDDLPCMDDDDLRRGQATVHKKFGEAPALLAGDALLTEAFAVLCPSPHLQQTLPIITQAAGIRGMIEGQSYDIGFEGSIDTLIQLQHLHQCKTGALIRASVHLGGIAAAAPPTDLEALILYGEAVGLAFQLADDVLDEEEDEAEDGPPSFVKLLGREETQRRALILRDQALEACSNFPKPHALQALAHFSVDRKH